MASSPSPILRLELMATGDNPNTWGLVTNNNLGTLLEQAIAGAVTITMADSNFTLSNINFTTDQARRMILLVTGALTATRTIIAPSVSKMYVIRNSTTGGQSIQIQTAAAGLAVTIPNNTTALVFSDGLDFFNAVSSIQNATITGGSISNLGVAIPVDSGGTGGSTPTTARAGIEAAKSGINNDISALTALVTPLSIPQGGTNATNANAARVNLGAAASGANSDITSLSAVTTPLTLAQGGTGANIAPILSGVAVCTSIGVLNLTPAPTTTGMLLTGSPGNVGFVSQFVAASIVIDGNGAPFSTGVKAFLQIPFNATITAVTLLAGQTGSVVVDIFKDTFANFPPTVADSICGAAKPTITAGDKYTDSTLTGWTKTITANDILAFNIDSVTDLIKLTVSLTLVRT